MKKSIKIFTITAVFALSMAANAAAYTHFLHLSVNANYFFHRDANFRDIYGEGKLSFGAKANFRIVDGFHLTGGAEILNAKGTIPETALEAEAVHRNFSAGVAYFFELSYAWDLRVGADLVYVDYEESAFGEKIEDIGWAYRLESALVWRISQDIYSEILVAYTYGTDDIDGRSIKLGGFQVGVGLAFRL